MGEIGFPLRIEPTHEIAKGIAVDGPIDHREKSDLGRMLFGRDELFEVTQIVNRKRKPIGVRRCARIVVQERHAPSPAGLKREEIARSGNIVEEDDVALSPRPRAKCTGHRVLDPEKTRLGEEAHRARQSVACEWRTPRPLLPPSTGRRANTGGDVFAGALGIVRGPVHAGRYTLRPAARKRARRA